jgi:predicted nucleotidyltransferase
LPNEKLILFGSQARGDAREDNTIVRTKKQWERGKGFPFYKNVTQEGIEIE